MTMAYHFGCGNRDLIGNKRIDMNFYFHCAASNKRWEVDSTSHLLFRLNRQLYGKVPPT